MMTTKARRILSKLHKTAFVGSLAVAGLVTLYTVPCAVHDYIVVKDAYNCADTIFTTAGLALQIADKEGTRDQKVAAIVAREKDSLRKECGCIIEDGSSVTLVKIWWLEDTIPTAGAYLENVRVYQIILLSVLWFVPLFLFGFKKWIVWVLAD